MRLTGFTGVRCLAVVGALVAGGVALALSSDRVIGPDDGIYLSTARALAETGTYSQSFLPVPLAQTKYPPLYAACLALVGLATSFDPPAFWHFKVVNAIALSMMVLVGIALVSQEGVTPWWATFGGVLMATAPALCSFVDLLATDLLFATLLLAALFLVPAIETRRGQVGLVVIAGAAVLTRAVGLALCLGLAWHSVAALGWRRARALVLGLALVTVPWFAWRALMLPAHLHPIDVYYVAYEPSAWQLLSARPQEALTIVWTNLRVYPTLVSMVFGWPAIWLALVAGSLSVWGIWRLTPARRGFVTRVIAIYVVALLTYHYPVDRYLVPLVPIAMVGLIVALAGLADSRDAARRGIAWGTAAVLVTTQGVWMNRYATLPSGAIHGAFGRPLHFEWDGFEEALTWIRARTGPTDVVASYRDGLVYLYTGRRGVRGWLHISDTWSEQHRRYLTPTEAAAIVRAEHRRLGVRYVLVSPHLYDVEGRFGRDILEALGAGTDELPLQFVSKDGDHKVYRVVRSGP